MTGIFALVACGPACWEAKDDLCKCSCGGKNHGMHRHKRPGFEKLKRQMVYQGFIFELADVSEPEETGKDREGAALVRPVGLGDKAQEINKAAGIRFLFAHTAREHFGEFPIAITRPVTEAQIKKWPELAKWRNVSPHSFALYGRPSIMWVRRDDLTKEVAARMNISA